MLESKWKLRAMEGEGEPTTPQKWEVPGSGNGASGFICSRIWSQRGTLTWMQFGHSGFAVSSTEGMPGWGKEDSRGNQTNLAASLGASTSRQPWAPPQPLTAPTSGPVVGMKWDNAPGVRERDVHTLGPGWWWGCGFPTFHQTSLPFRDESWGPGLPLWEVNGPPAPSPQHLENRCASRCGQGWAFVAQFGLLKSRARDKDLGVGSFCWR